MVGKLRDTDTALFSLVAEAEEQVSGHIVFSKVTTEFDLTGKHFLELAPLGVKSIFQGKSLGSQLARKELEICMVAGAHVLFVMGAPGLYERFFLNW